MHYVGKVADKLIKPQDVVARASADLASPSHSKALQDSAACTVAQAKEAQERMLGMVRCRLFCGSRNAWVGSLSGVTCTP